MWSITDCGSLSDISVFTVLFFSFTAGSREDSSEDSELSVLKYVFKTEEEADLWLEGLNDGIEVAEVNELRSVSRRLVSFEGDADSSSLGASALTLLGVILNGELTAIMWLQVDSVK